MSISEQLPQIQFRSKLVAVAPALILALAACSAASTTPQPSAGTREVAVKMVDIAFEPTTINVQVGETVHFVFTNEGQLPHEAVIGDEAAQVEHEEEMEEGGMAHEDEPGEVEVEPGEIGVLDHTFDTAGTFQIGCHVVGHYAAGMIATITVN